MTTTNRNLDARLTSYAPAILSLYRVVFGLLFLCHGSALLFGWPSGPAAPAGQWPSFYAGVLEFVTGVLITVGLFTRIAAFIASGVMAFAYFTVHLPKGFVPLINGGELSVLYCFGFFLLIFTGAGAFALDARRR
ncbi:membrane protein [Mycolicibacterium madagascariense]|uniref:Membrane protein n=1 Tax=Mycolicibacterium madagascariense TaxID=212765 RepID=A0A7I7XDJ9_9MYCO|nr:DoxX family protein [Mycolicibacterium madagascariense]MCV7015182.1 DoxX family protein [Mycolicibacterium madagascariense]BBZ27475.1 membrane protein [Mycolicibacterium madagascariense]